MPYDFNYVVKDDYYGTDYAHNAISDGDQVKGEYRVQLPDGRLQIVKYVADWKTGFHADVSYQGTSIWCKEIYSIFPPIIFISLNNHPDFRARRYPLSSNRISNPESEQLVNWIHCFRNIKTIDWLTNLPLFLQNGKF